MRNDPSSGERVAVSAADPLNLAGILVPGERVAGNSGRQVTFLDGVAIQEGVGEGRAADRPIQQVATGGLSAVI